MGADAVRKLLKDALAQGIGSGFSASFGRIPDLRNGAAPVEIHLGTTGHGDAGLPVTGETFFDLASLTKILGTTLLAMIRVEKGGISLDAPSEGGAPEGNPASNPRLTPRELLTHTSGLPAWLPLFEAVQEEFREPLRAVPVSRRRKAFDARVEAVPWDPAQRGTVVYSDIGFLRLERILTKDLAADLKDVFSAVPGLELHFRPLDGESRVPRERVMMTEDCPWRGLLQGEVHDDNAWSRGGVAGHAGLFGRLADLHLWMEALFSGRWVDRETLREFSEVRTDPLGNRRALGFDVPSQDGNGSTGTSFSSRSIGHLGFTGTSLWMDPDSGDFAVLLSNRVHPKRTDDRIRGLRREFHRLVRS